MEKLEINVERITNPPEKMLKMYEAVRDFLHENRDMASLKVSDITKRAGIGKGTAYEYFSSKEELLAYAAMWGIVDKIHELADNVEKKSCFREKCDCIFEWLEKYKEYGHIMIQVIRGNFDDCCGNSEEPVRGSFVKVVQGYLFQRIDEMLELGFLEGAFTETDKDKRALAFLGAVLQYAFVIMGPTESPLMQMGQKQLKDFVYESMIKALN